MEYMKLEGFLGRSISKLINKGIAAKLGYNPNINLNAFNLKTDDNGNVIVSTTLSLSQKDFERIFEEVTG
jgi:hypothetical protein